MSTSTLRKRPSRTADRELVAGVRGGDERSFEALVDRYLGPLTAYVCAKVGDLGRSEDIAQEVFIDALRSMRATERRIAFKPWLYAIARNACIDEYRRRRRWGAELALTDDLVEFDPLGDPQAALELHLDVAALYGALSSLPPTECELVSLRELVGLSYAEIAGRTGLSVPAVESALHRARRHLLARYGAAEG